LFSPLVLCCSSIPLFLVFLSLLSFLYLSPSGLIRFIKYLNSRNPSHYIDSLSSILTP
jgi:hypothetical protein